MRGCASVILKLVLGGDSYRRQARQLVRDAASSNSSLIAPPFFASEVDSVIRRRVHDGRLSITQARQAYALLDRAPVRLVAPPGLRHLAREWAERFAQRTVHDATYAALAQLRGCDFWTADRSFFDAVTPALPFVKYLPNYP